MVVITIEKGDNDYSDRDCDDYESIHFLVQEYKLEVLQFILKTHKMEAEFMMCTFLYHFHLSMLVNMTPTHVTICDKWSTYLEFLKVIEPTTKL
jgi:hypothetical protein